MKFRKFASLALAAVLCLVSVAAFADTDEEYEARIAELEAQVADLEHQLAAKDYVAEFDGGYVTAEEAMQQYNYVEYMYSAYGYSMDGYEDYIKNDIAQSMLKDKIIQFKATELGLATPTDEEAQQLADNAQTALDNYVENYRTSYEEEGKSEEDVIADTKAFLAENGVDYDFLYAQELETYASDKLFAEVVKDVSVTDEEVRARFDELVAADQLSYQDAYSYESARMNGTDIYWNPEGYRYVRQVLVAFDDDQSARYSEITGRISTLEKEMEEVTATPEPETTAEAEETATAEATEEAEATATAEATPEATQEPRSVEEIQADLDAANAELEALYAELKPTCDEVTAKFEEGESIDSLIATYGGDPGSINDDGTTNTYVVSADSASYDSAFVEAAMSVDTIGQLSAPANGRYGCYMVYYDSDVPAGEVDYDSVKEALTADLLEETRQSVYDAQIATWSEELHAVYYLENFR